LIFFGVSLRAAEPKFTASLDRNTITYGETATLSLNFEGVSPGGTPQLPPITNLVVHGVSTSTQMQFGTGGSSSTVSFNYTVSGKEPGEIAIPTFTVEIGGKKLTSQPLRLKVLKAGDNVADAGGQNQLAFVKLIVPKNEFYVGEMFPVEFQLYFQDAQDLQQPKMNTDGFTIGKQPGHTMAKAQVNGMVYNVVTFRLSLAAARTGPLKLGPFEAQLNLRLPRRSPQRDQFDPFGFFGRQVDLKPATLVSDAPVLNILPLPTNNVPPGFSGSIGSFTMTLSASPTNVGVGDPITLRVRIEGRGTLDSIALPSLDDWREFKAYPPTSKVESDDPLGITGAKIFELAVAPQNAEVKALPPLSFSYFDPELRSFRTLTHSPVQLVVRASALPPQQPTVLAGAGDVSPTATRDIVHIKLRPGALGVISPPLIQRPWFIGLQAVPMLAWMAAFIWRRRQDELANNPRLRRQLAVQQTVRTGLQELAQLAAANRAEEFFSTVFRLLQEQIGERLDQPASAITEEAVESLSGLGADAGTAGALHEIFQQCNEARYAPQSTPQELAAFAAKVETALRAVQALQTGENR
jgi:hypothetical protein